MQKELTKRLSSKISDNGVNLQDAIDEAYAEENITESITHLHQLQRKSICIDRSDKRSY